jgi:hypothetical protein
MQIRGGTAGKKVRAAAATTLHTHGHVHPTRAAAAGEDFTGAANRDAVAYWSDWRPDDVGAVNGRRCIRVVASMFLQVDQLCRQEAVAAVVNAVTEAMVEKRVDTQG